MFNLIRRSFADFVEGRLSNFNWSTSQDYFQQIWTFHEFKIICCSNHQFCFNFDLICKPSLLRVCKSILRSMNLSKNSIQCDYDLLHVILIIANFQGPRFQFGFTYQLSRYLCHQVIINSQWVWLFFSSFQLNSCCPYLPIFTAQCFNSLLEKSLTGLARKCCCTDKVEPLKRLYLCPWVYAQTPLFIECHMNRHLESP